MVDFMIIGLPRSGTTWAANWLTTDRTLCVHDPLWTMHYSDLDAAIGRRSGERLAGIACTGLWRWPQWLNAHPARKLVLHRNVEEVRQSLRLASLPPIIDRAADMLRGIRGRHIHWRGLFDATAAQRVWHYLTDLPFDAERHAELAQMRIDPMLDAVRRDMALNARLGRELTAG